MRATVSICLGCAILLGVDSSLAAAAPKIPSSALPGRERERFVDPPIARFFQPNAGSAPLLTVQPDCRPRAVRTSKQRRSKRQKGC
jgi:hypothetical protein